MRRFSSRQAWRASPKRGAWGSARITSMIGRPLPRLVTSILAAWLTAALLVWRAVSAAEPLPTRLADDEFWRIVTSFSERAGTFPSDNLLSNERALQEVIPDLDKARRSNGVYLGVGPEQNFTYIAAL